MHQFNLGAPSNLNCANAIIRYVKARTGHTYLIQNNNLNSQETRCVYVFLDSTNVLLDDTELTYATKAANSEYISYQFEAAKVELKNDLNSRRVVIDFWKIIPNKNAPPCWLSIHFMFRENILESYVFQRSMDVTKMKDDFAFMILLSNKMKSYLEKELGVKVHKVELNYFISNLHCYR